MTTDLPMDDIDLLIVDEMGKNISGQGLDPNVVGRDCCSYGAKRNRPRITRIFVRDLTELSVGSALGIGQADSLLLYLRNSSLRINHMQLSLPLFLITRQFDPVEEMIQPENVY